MPDSPYGVLLVNTGSPKSPHPWDVFCYLNQFLTDPKVVDIPVLARQLLVRGIIVPFRFLKSAKSYSAIWQAQGSPLIANSRALATALEMCLGEGYKVEIAMRYGTPSIEEGVAALKECEKIILLPLFPQYASATTGSCIEEAMRHVKNRKIHIISHFATDPLFIDAWSELLSGAAPFSYDHILFSFHGLPMRQIKKAKPCYKTQCEDTATCIAKKCELSQYSISYQSRLGPEKWIGPSTVDRLSSIAKEGYKNVLVIAPSFVADCLETLYEIEIEYRELFLQLGGTRLDLLPSLNTHPTWIHALSNMITMAARPH